MRHFAMLLTARCYGGMVGRGRKGPSRRSRSSCAAFLLVVISLGCSDTGHRVQTHETPVTAPWARVAGQISDQQRIANRGVARAVLRFRYEVWYKEDMEERGKDVGAAWEDVTSMERHGAFSGRRYVYIGRRSDLEPIASEIVRLMGRVDRDTLRGWLDNGAAGAADPLFQAMDDLAARPNDAGESASVRFRLGVGVTLGDGRQPRCGIRVTVLHVKEDGSVVEAACPDAVVEAIRKGVTERAAGVKVVVSTFDRSEESEDEDVGNFYRRLEDDGRKLQRVSTPVGVFLGKWNEGREVFHAVGLGVVEYHSINMCLYDDCRYFRKWLVTRMTVDRARVYGGT